MNAKTVAKRTLLISLPLAGVVLAIAVLVGGTDTEQIMQTAGYIFLADIYIVASLAARHRWLRLTIWVTTAISLVVSLIWAWYPKGNHMYAEYTHQGEFIRKTLLGHFSSVNITLHLCVVTFVLIGFFSFAWRFIASNRGFRIVYITAVIFGIGSWVVFAIGENMHERTDFVKRLNVAVIIIAITCMAVVVVGAIVTATQRRVAVRNGQAGSITAAGASAATGLAQTEGVVITPELEALITRIVDERITQRANFDLPSSLAPPTPPEAPRPPDPPAAE